MPPEYVPDPAGRGVFAECDECDAVAGPFALLSEAHRYMRQHQYARHDRA